jgi:uncharacterized protein
LPKTLLALTRAAQGIDRQRALTQEIVDLALECGVTFCLLYQLLYTKEQLNQTYPEIDNFFAPPCLWSPVFTSAGPMGFSLFFGERKNAYWLCLRNLSIVTADKMMHRVFDAWVGFMLRHRFLVLGLVGLMTIGFGIIAARLPLISALPDYIPKSPLLTAWEDARERFGGDEIVLLAVEADDHFTDAGLTRLKQVINKIEAHPFAERVVAITNAQQLRADPEDPESLLIARFVRDDLTPKQTRDALLADSNAKSLVSENGQVVFTLVQLVASRDELAVQPDIQTEMHKRLPSGAAGPGARPGQLLDMTKQVFSLELADWFVKAGYPEDKVHEVGFPVFIASIVQDAQQNLTVLLPITIAVVFIALIVVLRRFGDAMIPMLCIGPAVIWATAIGGLALGRLTIMTSLVPIMVLVVGVSDVVHLVTQFRHELARGHDKNEAIRLSFQHVGTACALTSLTTFIGFGSMILLPIPQSRELGVFAAFGVVAAFILSFVLTPIVLSFAKPMPVVESKAYMNDFLTRILRKVAKGVKTWPKAITAAGLVLTAVALGALLQVKIENSFVQKLAPSHRVRKAVAIVEEHNVGGGEIEVLVRTPKVDGVKDPRVISALGELKTRIKNEALYSNALSLADLLDQIDKVMAPDSVPPRKWTRAQIAQYLLLFEISGGNDLNQFLDDSAQYTRMTVRIGDGTAEDVNTFADTINREAKAIFPPGVDVHANGIGVLAARLAPDLLGSSLRGFSAAFGLIAVLLGLLFMSIRVGILSLIPNILPVALGIVAVYFALDAMDADTLAFIAVCIGIAVDDTIHFMARYRIERDLGRTREDAVEATILEAGHGIVRTSVVLTLGFVAMVFSDYQPIISVGLLLPITLISAVVLDLTLVPAMAQLGLLEPRLRTSKDQLQKQKASI